MHTDHHIAQFLLHTAVVNSLRCGTDVWGRGRGALEGKVATLIISGSITKHFLFLYLVSAQAQTWGWDPQALEH